MEAEYRVECGPSVDSLDKAGSLKYFLILLIPEETLGRWGVGPFSALVDLEQAFRNVLRRKRNSVT